MRRAVLVAVVVLVVLAAVARSHPVARPVVERLMVLTVAAAVLAVLVGVVARSLPEPAVTALDALPPAPAATPTLPGEVRRLATTGGRALVQQVGRERLVARGLDPDDPAAADAARALAGPDLWALVATPLDQPVAADLPAALTRLESL